VNTTQIRRTTVTPGPASARRYAATLCAAWLSVACVGLLASCTAAPEGASPAQADQPSDAETQVTQQPAGATRASPSAVAEADAPAAAPPVKPAATTGPPGPAANPQAEPGGTTPTTPTSAGQQRRPTLPPRASLATRPATTQPASGTEPGCGGRSNSTVPTPSPDGPQPRWVCEQPTITADPVWYGRPLDFVFEIRNEGEGDLRIQLKGG
jgi:hypothetical protein